MLEQCKNHLEDIAKELQTHDRKVDLFFEHTKAVILFQQEHQHRMERAIEKLAECAAANAKANGNGTSAFYKSLDLAMKVILTLVGLLALLTLGPTSASKLLGQ